MAHHKLMTTCCLPPFLPLGYSHATQHLVAQFCPELYISTKHPFLTSIQDSLPNLSILSPFPLPWSPYPLPDSAAMILTLGSFILWPFLPPSLGLVLVVELDLLANPGLLWTSDLIGVNFGLGLS